MTGLALGFWLSGCSQTAPSSEAPVAVASPTEAAPAVADSPPAGDPAAMAGSSGGGSSSSEPVYAAHAENPSPGARPLTPIDWKPPDPAGPHSFGPKQSWLPGYQEVVGQTNPVPVKPASLKDGEALWVANCAPCHGAQAEGDGQGSVDLRDRVRDLRDPWRFKYGATDQAIYRSIAYGLPGSVMGNFKGVLKEEQIWLLVNYLKSLQRKR